MHLCWGRGDPPLSFPAGRHFQHRDRTPSETCGLRPSWPAPPVPDPHSPPLREPERKEGREGGREREREGGGEREREREEGRERGGGRERERGEGREQKHIFTFRIFLKYYQLALTSGKETNLTVQFL